ncbi:hypothetical protein JTE90_020295 [Oedothorax gibbosus]|uniref:Uncharacterized protein n=1 Tax=Oedothorax gibbosus TaxID=931172 RepID=A0AAV6VML4_9ARAC|nr:hypothetical protein JTE90_020295 [Oedothorax gibbosus]
MDTENFSPQVHFYRCSVELTTTNKGVFTNRVSGLMSRDRRPCEQVESRKNAVVVSNFFATVTFNREEKSLKARPIILFPEMLFFGKGTLERTLRSRRSWIESRLGSRNGTEKEFCVFFSV